MIIFIRVVFVLSFFFVPLSISAENREQSFSVKDQTIEESPQNLLMNAPKNLNIEHFESDDKKIKYPLKLVWTPIKGVSHYEVEITRSYTCSRRYFKAMDNSLDVMIFPNARYLWRVVAYSGDNVVTDYSRKYKLFMKSPPGDHLVSHQEKSYEENTGRSVASSSDNPMCVYPVRSFDVTEPNIVEPEEEPVPVAVEEIPEPVKEFSSEAEPKVDRVPAYSHVHKYSLWGNAWVRGGAGVTNSTYKQDVFGDSRITHSAIAGPTYYGEVGAFITKKIGIVVNGSHTDGEFEDDQNLLEKEYVLQRISAEFIYTLGSDWDTTNTSQWHLRLGAKYNDLPIIEAFPSASQLTTLSHKLTSGSLGLGYRSNMKTRFRSEIHLNVLYPFSSELSENNIELDTTLKFDAAVHLNYQIYKNYHLGLFWQGEFMSIDYSMDDDFDEINGNQVIFNNNAGVYLGIEF